MTKMALDSRAATFATETKLAPEAVQWLISEGITDVSDIAQIAHDDASCNTDFILVAFAAGVKALEKSGPKVAARRFWKKCRYFEQTRDMVRPWSTTNYLW